MTSPKQEQLSQYLSELEEIDGLLKKRKVENGIFYYIPNPKQYKFHCSRAKRILYVGSNRSGKTSAGMCECVMHALGWYPEWYPKEKRRDTAQKILWISPLFAHLIKFVEPKLMSFLPKEAIVRKPKRTAEGAITHLEIKHSSGGISTIEWMSQEQSLSAFEGADYDIVVADEPLARAIFTAVTRGLIDRGGIMFMLFTPIEQQWIKEELCDNADGKFIELFQADIEDNLFDIKGNPILNKEYIKEFERTLSEDDKEIRLHGRWYHLSGMVFKELDRSVHVIDDFPVPKDAPIWYVLDPHDRNPHWSNWIFMDKTMDCFVCGEFIRTGEPTEFTKEVFAHEKAMNWKPRRRIIDPNFGNKPKSVGSKIRVIDQFKASGMRNLVLGVDEQEGGRLKIRTALRFDKTKPIGISNRPKLYFFKNGARESYRSLSNLQYEDWTKKATEVKGLRENLQQKNKHIHDVLLYLYNSNPRYEQIRVEDDLEKPIY